VITTEPIDPATFTRLDEIDAYAKRAYEVIDGEDVPMNTGGGTDWDKFDLDMRTFAVGPL
jgi:hypothetical protein